MDSKRETGHNFGETVLYHGGESAGYFDIENQLTGSEEDQGDLRYSNKSDILSAKFPGGDPNEGSMLISLGGSKDSAIAKLLHLALENDPCTGFFQANCGKKAWYIALGGLAVVVAGGATVLYVGPSIKNASNAAEAAINIISSVGSNFLGYTYYALTINFLHNTKNSERKVLFFPGLQGEELKKAITKSQWKSRGKNALFIFPAFIGAFAMTAGWIVSESSAPAPKGIGNFLYYSGLALTELCSTYMYVFAVKDTIWYGLREQMVETWQRYIRRKPHHIAYFTLRNNFEDFIHMVAEDIAKNAYQANVPDTLKYNTFNLFNQALTPTEKIVALSNYANHERLNQHLVE